MSLEIHTTEQWLDKWLLDNPDHSLLDVFNFGRSFADPDDIFQNIMTWNDQTIADLIYKLLKARRVPVSTVIDAYAKYLQSIISEKSSTIDELSVNLVTFRHKIYSAKDVEECNERADKILKTVGWELNSQS